MTNTLASLSCMEKSLSGESNSRSLILTLCERCFASLHDRGATGLPLGCAGCSEMGCVLSDAQCSEVTVVIFSACKAWFSTEDRQTHPSF